MLGGGNDRLFGVLCDRLGRPDWKTDERFMTNSLRVKNRHLLEDFIEEVTKGKTTQEWLDVLDESGMPYAAVNDIQGTLNHEHGKSNGIAKYKQHSDSVVLARNMVREVDHPTCGSMKLVNTPVKFSHSEPSIRSPPPLLGQHTDEVLRDMLSMNEEEIQALRKEGIVA